MENQNTVVTKSNNNLIKYILITLLVIFLMFVSFVAGLLISYKLVEPNLIPPIATDTQDEEDDEDIEVDDTEEDTFVTKTITLEGSRYGFGATDLLFTAQFPKDVKISDSSTSRNIGSLISADNLSINFSLPYESPSYTYDSKVFVESDESYGDIYRVTKNDGTVFYTNIFDETVGYCLTTTGSSTDCARPILFNTPEYMEGSRGMLITCELKTDTGLLNCDDVVKSIVFLD